VERNGTAQKWLDNEHHDYPYSGEGSERGLCILRMGNNNEGKVGNKVTNTVRSGWVCVAVEMQI
jgi:hypothetical protein